MSQTSPNSDIVFDDGRTKLSDLWKKEDYWAIWLGFAILIFGFFVFIAGPKADFEKRLAAADKTMSEQAALAPFRTIEYYGAQDAKGRLRSRDSDMGKQIAWLLRNPGRWNTNPVDAFFTPASRVNEANEKAKPAAAKAKEALDAALAAAKEAQAAATEAQFKDEALNKEADSKIAAWRKARSAESSARGRANQQPVNLVPSLLMMLVISCAAFSVGMLVMGKNVPKFAIGFIGVFALAVIAMLFGNQATIRSYGLSFEAWAIILGMLIANTVRTPEFVKPGLQTEFFIKTGLVLLGAEILFDKVMAIGIPGIFVTWVSTPTVLICMYLFGQHVLKMESKTLNIVLNADQSVCGVSAAIATASACRAKKEELALAVGISLAFTSIMMIAMPAAIVAMGMPAVMGGAWIGTTIDSTGAVAAAGAVLGQTALYVAATVKMIQNVLIGIIAFGVAVYWTAVVEPAERIERGEVEAGYKHKVSAWEIWNRFPKFVLGFIGASIVVSSIGASLGPDLGNAVVSEGLVRGLSTPLRSWCFALAFASIGLSTNFRELAPYFKGGKPFTLYLTGQAFNMTISILLVYFMFYVVFPEITAAL